MDVVTGLLSSVTGETQSKHDLNAEIGEKAQIGKRREEGGKESNKS